MGPHYSARLAAESGAENIQFVIPWDIQSITGGIMDIGYSDKQMFDSQKVNICQIAFTMGL